jgi:hypothetical protein
MGGNRKKAESSVDVLIYESDCLLESSTGNFSKSGMIPARQLPECPEAFNFMEGGNEKTK